MAKVVDFLKTLLSKAGANVDQDVIKNALAAMPADLEMSDDVATAIDNGLLSLSAAKNNHGDIKNHYTALALKGLDNELKSILEGEKLPDEIISEINAETSSYKRVPLLVKKIKELEGKKAGASKTDKDEYQRQITELNNKLREQADKEQGIHAGYKDQIRDVKKNFHLNTLLSGYKTRFDDLGPDARNTVILSLINKHLATKGATLTVDENDQLILINKDGSTTFGDDHRQLTPKSFLDKVMSDEKLVIVNDSNGSQGGQQNNYGSQGQYSNGSQGQYFQQRQNGQQNGQQGKPKSSMISHLIQESQQALAAGGNGAI